MLFKQAKTVLRYFQKLFDPQVKHKPQSILILLISCFLFNRSLSQYSFCLTASATREPLGALRCPSSIPRVSIIGRDDFFVRYGDKEREAVASFDFLEELSTTSASGASSCDQPPALQSENPSSPSHLSLSDSCAASFSGSEPSLDVQQIVLAFYSWRTNRVKKNRKPLKNKKLQEFFYFMRFGKLCT